MNDRIDIIVQARQTAPPLSQGPAQGGGARTPAGAPTGPALPSLRAGIQDLAVAAAGVVSLTGALEVGARVAQSFGEAFRFKTDLDAANASIAIQLRGIRDSAQVFAEANRYGERYKLTQEEISNTIQASVGIFRTSRASVQDTFGVLQRLTVLAPGKSIQDAAFSVRELASGDITSLSEQFNISRKRAYELRDAINGGADTIQVLSQYLNESGVGMDALAAKTEGAAGKFKDLTLAQEQLKLAQADLAAGPGLVFLQVQTEATIGLTRVLSGDFSTALDAVQARYDRNRESAELLARVLRGDLAGAMVQVSDGFGQGTRAGGDWGQAQEQATPAIANTVSALHQQNSALAESLSKQQQAALSAQEQAALQNEVAQAAARVAAGISTQAAEVAGLQARYPGLSAEADVLISQQLRLATTTDLANQKLREQRFARQQAEVREVGSPFGVAPPTGGRPGARGAGDSEIDRIAQEQRAAADEARAIAAAREDRIRRTGTITQQVAQAQLVYNAAVRQYGRDSSQAMAAETELIALRQQQAASADRVATKTDNALTSQQRATDTALNQIENRYEDFYRRLTQLQEDYALRSSRSQEDYQEQRQRLLAEGRRFEAEQLRKEFEKQQRRAAEDYAIQRRRQEQDAGLDAGRIQDRAAIRGVNVDAATLRDVAPGGTLVAPGSSSGTPGGSVVQVVVNAQVILDGQAVGRLVAPTVEQELLNGLVQLQITAPPNPPGTATGGPRP